MFGKNKSSIKQESAPQHEKTSIAASSPEPQQVTESQPGNTVIASDVCFEGNINSSGIVYVHGKVQGNIESLGGMVKVMRNGFVEGNINAREVVIDGTLSGQCFADVIDIYENGKIIGAINYHTLAIKRGGEFSGQAETRPAVTSNVIEMAPEITEEIEKIDLKAALS